MKVSIMTEKQQKEYIDEQINQKIEYLERIIDDLKLKIIDLEQMRINK